MAIEYEKLAERTEKWGIDVTVRFHGDGIDTTKTFCFKDKEILASEYTARMAKARANLQNDLEESRLPSAYDIADKLEEHFTTNDTITKEDFESLKETGELPVKVIERIL